MNKNKILTGALVALLVLAGLAFIILSPKRSFNISRREYVKVKDGVVTPGEFTVNFHIDKDGKYSIHAFVSAVDAPGIVTVAEFYDKAGNEIFTVTGAAFDAESAPVELKAGEYRCRFLNLADIKSYKDYLASHAGLKEEVPLDEYIFKDGEWALDYNVEAYNTVGNNASRNGMIIGLIVGLLIVVLLLFLIRDPNAPVKEYDERQVAAKGKAYKYGFYSFLIWFGLAVFASEADVAFPVSTSVLMFLGLLFAAAVMVTVSVMNDAYFRMDEKRGTFTGVLCALAVTNILLGVTHITKGDVFVDGKMTFMGSANLLVGIFTAYLLIILLIKYLLDKREE
jgi:hypothetical protein